MAVVYEQQSSDISWYADPTEGTAKDNFERILELRKAFCHPLMINEDATLNDKYFSNAAKETAVNWTDIEILQLYEGIFKYGVDSVEKWIQIKGEFLPQRDFIEVRLKLSQILGVQDLSIYKGRKFKNEKDLKEEFTKNKAKAMADGTWADPCDVALKAEVAALTPDQIQSLETKELAMWNQFVYNNPIYIYRTGTKQSRDSSAKQSRESSKAPPKGPGKQTKGAQKNTIDGMLKKQAERADAAKKDKEAASKPAEEASKDIEQKPTKKKQPKKKGRKQAKGAPLLPESSDDEELLCVE